MRSGRTGNLRWHTCNHRSRTHIQVFCGFLVAPVLANLLEDVHVAPVIGPLVSQLLLVWGADFVISRGLQRGGTSDKVFFRYIAKPLLLIEAVVAALAAIGVGVGISTAVGSPVSSSSIDLRQLLDQDMPSTMMATGLTTVALTPWIEERIWRGFVLQGAIPFVGIPGAVRAAAIAPQPPRRALTRLVAIQHETIERKRSDAWALWVSVTSACTQLWFVC